ncbi:MAG: hypothetical protein ABSB49_02965 [Polyangia bacterium]
MKQPKVAKIDKPSGNPTVSTVRVAEEPEERAGDSKRSASVAGRSTPTIRPSRPSVEAPPAIASGITAALRCRAPWEPSNPNVNIIEHMS